MKTYNPVKTIKDAFSTKSQSRVSSAATLSDEDLEEEISKRRKGLVFPLDVFPSEIAPLLSVIHHKMEGERAFIGQSVLSMVSSAIGSSLVACAGGWETPLTQWSVSVGVSSSGKTMVQKILRIPLDKVQAKFNHEYKEFIQNKNDSLLEDDEPTDEKGWKKKKYEPYEKPFRRTVFTNDMTFEALIAVMKNNFKGITKYEDELVKWFDDMNRYKSGSSELAFWTSGWAAPADFQMERKSDLTIIEKKHMVISVTGGTQPALLYRFFDGDKAYSGFSFRFLFALAEQDRVINPDLSYRIPDELMKPYTSMINYLYYGTGMQQREDDPIVLRCRDSAVRELQEWQTRKAKEINQLERGDEFIIKSGILGKNKEYCLRFAATLCAMDMACQGKAITEDTYINIDHVSRAIRLAEYFFQSGWQAYEMAMAKKIVPPEVLEFAAAYRHADCNQTRMSEMLQMSRQTINKKLNKYMKAYPGAFNAKNA